MDMISPDVIERLVLVNRDRHPVEPEIFADQRRSPRHLIKQILGNPVALHVMDRMQDLAALRQPADHLLLD